jgi:hypothetical protein
MKRDSGFTRSRTSTTIATGQHEDIRIRSQPIYSFIYAVRTENNPSLIQRVNTPADVISFVLIPSAFLPNNVCTRPIHYSDGPPRSGGPWLARLIANTL